VMKQYTNITNVIARISCGLECDKNAILINAHYDTQFGTVGATDDALPTAVMLEVARILAYRSTPLRNSLILLFNGAEESLQDASHAFSTQHPLVSNVRAFINLEAMGNKGKEILFQANSMGMVEAYKHVPYPHGSVVSNDIFRTGLILSDTDFRQFVDYGNLFGMDMALYQNSYTYHTMLDVQENIPDGVYQHMGENIMGILEHLLGEAEIESFTESRDFVYYDILDNWFVVYNWNTATAAHIIVILFALMVFFRPAFLEMMNTGKSFPALFAAHLWTLGSVAVTMVTMIGSSALVGVVLQFGLGKPMSYFRAEWLAFILYYPATLTGLIGAQVIIRSLIPSNPLDNPVTLEKRTYIAIGLWYIFMLTLTTIYKLGFAYVFMIQLAFHVLSVSLDRFLNYVAAGTLGSVRPIRIVSYLTALVIPYTFSFKHALSGILLFVPLTGRLGPDAPTDVIVGILVGLGGSVCFPLLISWSSRMSLRKLKVIWVRGILVTGLVGAVFAFASFPYDMEHPKRFFIQFHQNVTSGERNLHISHADPPSMDILVDRIAKEFGVTPTMQPIDDRNHAWPLFYPFSNFIVSHHLDLTPLHLDKEARKGTLPPPTLSLLNEKYDFDNGVREITLQCYHPNHIATALHFDADLVSWSLASAPLPGRQTHVIKFVGGYGTNTWNVTLAIKDDFLGGKKPQKIHFTGLERDVYETLENWHKAGMSSKKGNNGGFNHGWLRWIWNEEYESGKVLRRAEDALPEWVSSVHLAAATITIDI
ncbi:hypothetical protein HDV05_007702, partial [Chytridiales sp. JEL 0842]